MNKFAAWLLLCLSPLAGGAALAQTAPPPPTAARSGPPSVALWPKGAPGPTFGPAEDGIGDSQGDRIIVHVQQPTITPYLPAPGTETGAAVIIAPGGGHMKLSIDFEGTTLARQFAAHGVAAFVLKYRLALEPNSTYTIEGDEFADILRSVRLVRSRSAEWRVDPARVGVMGFSAGGLLAAMASWRETLPPSAAHDAVDSLNARPAFTALIYPNIPQATFNASTPPTFLLVGEKDSVAIGDGVPQLFLQLKHAGVPTEMHVLGGLGHGFGIRENSPPHLAIWPTLFINWLDDRGMLKPKQP